MITFMPMLMWVAALVSAAVSLYVSSKPLTLTNMGQSLLRWLFVFPLGTLAIWDFATFGFLPQTMAERFGWAPSPFQMEVAFANLGLGAASYFAAFAKRPARIAVALAAACYLVGSGLSLINNILDGDDLAAGLAGAILLESFLTPVAVLMLLFLGPQAEEQREEPQAFATTADRVWATPGAQLQPGRAQAAPPRPTPAPPGSQERLGRQEALRPPRGHAEQDAFGRKAASGLQERAPWEGPSKPVSGNAARPEPAPRSAPPPRAEPRPQPVSPPKPGPSQGGFDQSLQDELEQARRQMMQDLPKGRKPGS